MTDSVFIHPSKLHLPRCGSLFLGDAKSIHASHSLGLLHTRFEDFWKRRADGWIALRELVLATHMLEPDEERLFDVVFFFGPMPMQRAHVWAHCTATPPWLTPWREREGFVEIDPQRLPAAAWRRVYPRPTKAAWSAFFEDLDTSLRRQERARKGGMVLTIGLDAWLRLARTTISGAPDMRSLLGAAHERHFAVLRELLDTRHANIQQWFRFCERKKLRFRHWLPLGLVEPERVRELVLLPGMSAETKASLFGAPAAAEPTAAPSSVKPSRARRSETPQPASSGTLPDPRSAATPSTSASPARCSAPKRRAAR